ncbi:MAG: TIGR03960 family B12-binding radical SAM protein, partial [Endomicrobia bacterium]|nr:TIGR03960 family B12-binding radical SAM protein [Endomicrobiia bacterium]
MAIKSQIDEILNLVQRPARYINSELNSHPADMSADFSVCLCFPDIYEVGASNLGLEILYHLVNENKLARCERAFAPDTDMEKLLRERNIPLFSLESNSDLKSFDIIGFTIQCELVATNIVNMLDLSGIPVFSKERGEASPLIIGGGPALTNPEPFADFFDLFVLGDGEEAMPLIINLWKETKNMPKAERLKKLSGIEGVYVPSLYNVDYNADETVKSVVPAFEGVKPVVNKRILNLENAYFPEKKIVPFVETVHNRLNVEVARGCPGQCRFCQASKYYRPWRQRPLEKLLELVKKGISATGYEEVAFSSLSCSDYRQLDKLLLETNNLYLSSNLNISLPSLRCNEHSLKVARYINRSKRPTLTFAPEAGSDRLRNVIGKYLSEKQIVETLLCANAMGWSVIKLYFMIGLPTETDEDIAAVNTLVRLIKKEAKGLNFNITVSPFVPKAQTAFQWEPMAESAEIKEKIDYLSAVLPADVKAHNYRSSVLEAFIAKGDRRVSQVIYKAWQK